MDAFVATAPARWGISPETAVRRADRRQAARPAARSTPNVGPTLVVVGDAAGSVNPFNGEGISLAYETGRLAADAVDLALATGDGLALAALPAAARRGLRPLLQGRSRLRARDRQPGGDARAHASRDAQSRPLMEWVLRIMANLLRPDELGPAEAAYAVAALVAVRSEPLTGIEPADACSTPPQHARASGRRVSRE